VPSSSPFSFAFAASYTAEPIEPAIQFWSAPLASRFECHFAPFGQLIQTLLDPSSAFATNRHGLNVLLFRIEDLGEPARRDENLHALFAAVEARAAQLPAPLLIVPDQEIDSAFNDLPSVYILSPSQVDHWYPTKQKLNEQGDQLGAIPYTEDYFVALGASIVRAAHAINKAPHKVLALDCDNTLWKGICGEDGPDGVSLTPGNLALQQFALRQRQAGMLLAISSKNNEADVVETFDRHPEFPLRLSDITAKRINWLPKPLALASMATELSLSLDSFIFLDDSHREISEVDEELPEVLALCLPADTDAFAHYLNHIWAFDQLKLTQADASRAASYQGVQEFGKALHDAGSLEHFYSTLELEVDIRPVSGDEIPRAAQLTQRTNQFNFTTIRRSEGDIRNLLDSGVEVHGIHVRDRFGDYGFTGLLIGQNSNGHFVVDTFLLSCRILGRGVEHLIMNWLGKHASELQCQAIDIAFEPTQRNAPANEFWRTLPSAPTPAELAMLSFAPNHSTPVEQPAPKHTPAEHCVDYDQIATSLNSVAAIRKQMRKHAPVQLETPTETRLAAIWQDLLECEHVSGSSNFFDLGGHSLKVVLLLMRVTEEFGVSLGIEDVYASEVSLERMARRIDELTAFGGVGHEEYTRILRAIESMSEQDANAAWLEESQPNADPSSR
jgi:FkbH-like protein